MEENTTVGVSGRTSSGEFRVHKFTHLLHAIISNLPHKEFDVSFAEVAG